MADSTILALDIGEKRIGVARANSIALIAEPLTTLANNDSFIEELNALIKEHNACLLVVGLPKNLNDNPTSQTRYTQEFADQIRAKVDIVIAYQNEALSSVAAKNSLSQRGRSFDKAEVDSAAAAVILDNYIESNMSRIKQLV